MNANLTDTQTNQINTIATYVKININASLLFSNASCQTPGIPTIRSENFAYSGNKVTAIHFCQSTSQLFRDIVAGFYVYIDHVEQAEWTGCIPLGGNFDIIEFADDEIVLGIDFYTGIIASSYHVLTGMAVHTNAATYGPFGLTENYTKHTMLGYNLQGLSGTDGYAIDMIIAHFERC